MQTDVVVLAGGRGERFWPLSRRSRPKQILGLVGDSSLLRATVDRALHRLPLDRIWAVAPVDLESVLRAEVPEIAPERWIWETVGKNTAPAVGGVVAAILEDARREGEVDRRVLVLPADHWIPDADSFWTAVDAGERIVDGQGSLVTFGIRVSRPEIGYGYIERGEPIDGTGLPAFAARQFHEKPERTRAEEYERAGRFYWNAGIFLFSALRMAEEICRHAPELESAFEALQEGLRRTAGEDPAGRRTAVWNPYFTQCPSISIDRAVMERSDRVAVIEAPFVWDDLGSWTSWGDHATEDDAGNRIRGEVLALDAVRNVVYSDDGGMVAILGVEDLVVVRTADATLVCPRGRVQEIRELVRLGQAKGLSRF